MTFLKIVKPGGQIILITGQSVKCSALDETTDSKCKWRTMKVAIDNVQNICNMIWGM